jgi:hypothetical protein
VSYTYDRLWEQKLSQVYRLLVPINTVIPTEQNSITELIEENSAYENSSHIYESILRSAEGE